MIWDILVGRRVKGSKSKPRDEVDVMIDVIEKFAPRQYRSERETFYYNYRIVHAYLKTLLPLLETVSRKERFKSDQTALARDLFLKLKKFYDPKNRLSLEEAVEDSGMIKKYRELFLFFYGKEYHPSADLKKWVRGDRHIR